MELRLTDHEKQLLLEILQERHSSVIHEIARTDYRDYKRDLQQRCSEIEGILKKIQVEEHVPA
jgi:predicted transcriptional regulator